MSKLDAFLKTAAKRRERTEAAAPESVANALAQRLAAVPLDEPVKIAEGPPANLSRFLTKRIAENNPMAYAEIERIVGLPVMRGFSDAEREAFQLAHVNASFYEQGFRLHDLQCDAALAYDQYGTLFGPIGVGWGKTAITLLIAGLAKRKGVQRSLLLVPPQVYPQLTKKDLPWARRRLNLNGCVFHGVSGSPNLRKRIAKSGKPGCYILPYSMLSTKDAEDLLAWIQPELIIGDEAHMLKRHTAARTKRLMKYIRQMTPQCVWLSGTITSKSVMDYLHLVLPMNELCPLPQKKNIAIEWAATLDSTGAVNESKTGPILPLIEWASAQPDAPDCPYTVRGFRYAYRHRLQTNPAVVTSGDNDVGTTLTLSMREPTEDTSRELDELIEQVEEEWTTPTGDEIEHAMHLYKWMFELSAGFYNELYWPDREVVARRKECSLEEADALLEKAIEHHAVLQVYHRHLRTFLTYTARKGLDTPMLVAAHMKKHGAKGVDPEMYKWWREAHDLKEATPNMPERDSRVVRVDPYKVNYAKAWAEEHKTGVIWYYHKGVGDWLAEAIPDAVYCPAGKEFNTKILETEGKLVIASLTAHGTGKNLQFHQNQLYVQWPRPAALAEQSLGRLHRFGQEADELIVDVLCNRAHGVQPPTFDEVNFAATLNDALYIHQSTGIRQKVIYGQYDPTPRVFSKAVLEERGMEGVKTLTDEQQKLLTEKFDGSLDPRLRAS